MSMIPAGQPRRGSVSPRGHLGLAWPVSRRDLPPQERSPFQFLALLGVLGTFIFSSVRGAFNIPKNFFRGTDKITTAAQQLGQLVRDWCQGVIIGIVAIVSIKKGPKPQPGDPLPRTMCHSREGPSRNPRSPIPRYIPLLSLSFHSP